MMTSDNQQSVPSPNEIFYQSLFSSMPLGVINQDANGRITLANPAAERILGLSQAQLQGQSLADLSWRAIQRDGSPFPPEGHPSLVAMRLRQPVHNTVMGVFPPQAEGVTWLRINAVPQFQPGAERPNQVFCTFEDITAQIEAENAAQQQRRLANALQTGLETLTASLDEDIVLQHILETAVDIVPFEAATILLLEGTDVRMTYCHGFSPEIQEEIKKHAIPLTQPRFHELYYHHTPYLIEDAHQLPEWLPIPGTGWIRSSIAVPIETHDVVLGILTVDHSKPSFYTTTDVALLHAIARQAALALVHTYRTIFLQNEIKRQTHELSQSQQQQGFILSNISDAILLLDEDLNVQVANKTFYTMFGFAEGKALQGVPLSSLLHTQDAPGLLALAHNVLAEQVEQEGLLPLHRLDNDTLFLAELRLGYANSEQHHARIICSVRDVTTRESLKAALYDSEKRWQFALEGSGDGLWDWDLISNTVYYSPHWKSMLGYDVAEIGDGLAEWQNRVHPDDLDDSLAAIQAHLAGDTASFMNEHRMLCRDGTYKWVLDRGQVIERDENGRPLRAIGIHTDISRSKQVEADLLQQASLLQLLMDLALDFINVPLRHLDEAINDALGRVAQFNNADRAYLLAYNWDTGLMNNTHEWCAPGIIPEIENLQQVPMALFPDWIEAHTAGRPIHVPNVAALPDGPLRDILAPQGIQTLITLPLFDGNTCFGCVGFDAVNSLQHWTKEDVTLLQMLAELLVNAEMRRLSETAVKQAEARLKQNEMRLRKAQRIAKLGYWELDLTTNAVHGSDEMFTVFGLNPDEPVPSYERFMQAIHPDDLPIYTQTVRQAVKNGVPYELEMRILRPDGSVRHCLVRSEPLVDETGHTTRIDGTLLDITDQIETERALRDLTNRLELALRSGNIGIWEWKSENEALYVDARMGELFGLAGDERHIFPDGWSEIVHPDDFPLLVTQISQMLENGQEMEFEFRTHPQRGEVHYLKSFGIVQRDKNQQHVERLIGVGMDVTQEKQLEQVLRQALQREKELGELKSRFVSMASHEYRNPLAIILATVETLLAYRSKLSDDQLAQRLKNIRQQIFFLRDMTDDVLQLSRIESGRSDFNPTQVDLDKLCRAVLREYAEMPDMKHEIHYRVLCPTPVWHWLDERMMRQVMANLLSNAMKYSPNGQDVFVALDVQEDTAVLSIRDQGIGIPSADQENLFEPFYRAANVGTISGTGLGLPIARRLVKLHGGQITVLSAPDAGSTFCIHLPLRKEAEHD
ncbi:MAG: PAS domain-containing protein [Chloroflexota bacterium]